MDGMRTATGPRTERNGSVITVALVDDHAAIRSGLAMILRQHDDIDVVAEAGDGASAVTVTRTHQPDVVLMDVRMPGTDGIRSEERTSELQSLMRISYAVFCLKKKKQQINTHQ